MKKRPLVIIAGPTGVGKTKLSIQLAKAIGGEIISCDSVQVYRGMDIGSAKITQEEMEQVPHYLIDVLDPTDDFNVMLFQQMAKEAMETIYQKGKIPILVGGTAFYTQALLRNIDFTKESNPNRIRRELEDYANEYGNQALHQRLLQVDPKSAEIIHYNNRKRVIRALEYYQQTGTPISAHNEIEKQKESPYNFCYFVLNDRRELLYQRIDQRVDEMIKLGLVQEVETLLHQGCTRDMTSMQALGYKEIIAYLQGECSLEQAIYTIKRDTRHFAKRQLTWYRREPDIIWINKDTLEYNNDNILAYMLKQIQERGIK